MSVKLETLVVEIEAQTKELKKEVDEAKQKIEEFARHNDESTKKIKDAIGTISYAAVARSIKNLALSSAEAASDLNEVQNVVDVSFGAMAWKVEQFTQNSITQFGISELAAKQTAGTYMSMGTAMGVAEGKAAEMALEITGLSGDMASFYNVSQEVASSALRGIWTGETEALKNYGIVMTEAALEEYALSQGIKTKISDMTEAEKVQLRYNFVMQATAKAQGDFARTSGEYSNQVKQLKNNLQQLNAIAGETLVQFAKPILQSFNESLTWLNSESPVAIELIQVMTSAIAGLGVVVAALSFKNLLSFLNVGSLQFVALSAAIGAVIYSASKLSGIWGFLDGSQQAATVLVGITTALAAFAVATVVAKASVSAALGVAALAAMLSAAAAAEMMVGDIANTATSDFSSPGVDVGAALGVSNYAGSSASRAKRAEQIGTFADGGVLTKPTLGLMAEYPGASQNPEIVTPQSIMYDTVKQALSETSRTETINLTTLLDGEVIYRNQQKIKNRRGVDYSEGMGVFAR